jgi:hypothetical protein
MTVTCGTFFFYQIVTGNYPDSMIIAYPGNLHKRRENNIDILTDYADSIVYKLRQARIKSQNPINIGVSPK